MMNRNYQDYRRIFRSLPLPLAFVDLDLLDVNIRNIVARAHGKSVRVASKSVRSIDMLRHIMTSDPIFQGLMVFTGQEAIYLLDEGFDDLLLGYPIWDVGQIAELCNRIKQGHRLTLMVDSIEHIRHLAAIAAAQDVIVPICIDVDMSIDFGPLHFGVWRSPLNAVTQVMELYRHILDHPRLVLQGIMGYEAQIAGLADYAPSNRIRAAMIRFLKRLSVPRIEARRREIVEALTAAGARLRIVNGGGTGSVETTRQEALITEVTVGSGFFAPALFDHYASFHHMPAAGFAVQIVRNPQPGIYTCLGGGYVASGGAGQDKVPQVYMPRGAKLTSTEAAGEVQTPVLYSGSETLRTGDPIFMRHAKAGELCERFNELWLIQGGEIVGKATTYRGDGYAFL